MSKDTSELKGWTFLTGDRDWSGVNGTWCRKAKDGAWFVLQFQNMKEYDSDAVESGEWDEFDCSVKRLHLAELDFEQLESALQSSGFSVTKIQDELIVEMNGDQFEGQQAEYMMLDSCIMYGLGAPLHTETASKHPIQVRGRARRVAEEMMRDASKLDSAMDRPVNAIGSTAREFGVGNIGSAIRRIQEQREPTVTMGTLHEDGTLTNVKHIKHSTIKKCRFFIIDPQHYREDNTCKCDDAEERQRLIESYDYSEADFAGISLRGNA